MFHGSPSSTGSDFDIGKILTFSRWSSRSYKGCSDWIVRLIKFPFGVLPITERLNPYLMMISYLPLRPSTQGVGCYHREWWQLLPPRSCDRVLSCSGIHQFGVRSLPRTACRYNWYTTCVDDPFPLDTVRCAWSHEVYFWLKRSTIWKPFIEKLICAFSSRFPVLHRDLFYRHSPKK